MLSDIQIHELFDRSNVQQVLRKTSRELREFARITADFLRVTLHPEGIRFVDRFLETCYTLL